MAAGAGQDPPGGGCIASREAKEFDRDVKQLARAVADWDVQHAAGLTPDMRDGIALALRPAARHALAEARRAGLSLAYVQRDVLAELDAGLAAAGGVSR